ncbi:hypothetical protein G9F72_010855 [Clostridium estertheticum]|uniref:hypothetical protein n=1 Tax=Clostridium estertheticum TaxID=238834 RepID=UPI001CD1110E|nr:hypothetical protein [Clostridium estertheticum]MBZ9686824.1 hypothetical protein [Clostridium estertheticum]
MPKAKVYICIFDLGVGNSYILLSLITTESGAGVLRGYCAGFDGKDRVSILLNNRLCFK